MQSDRKLDNILDRRSFLGASALATAGMFLEPHFAQAAGDPAAADLVINNSRIIVGNGDVIERGSIVVRGGRISRVSSGSATLPGAQAIDARGLTAVPGFIDAHRHIMRGNSDQWLKEEAVPRMQEFLDAGYTTLLSGAGPVPGILQLKQRIDSGEIKGPRVIPSGNVPLRNITPDQARAQVQKLAGMGIKFIGEEGLTAPDVHPDEMKILEAIIDESKKHEGVLVMVHAVSVPTMIAAVDAGAPLLVHTPMFGWQTYDDSHKLAAAGVKQLSTIGFGVPVFGVFANDNKPRFRDGRAWPDAILGGQGEGREAGYKAVNARTSWDGGVVYGYGTDTNYLPKACLSHELRSLNLMFSPLDLVKLMGPNTAAFIQMSDQVGTLEAGKFADIVLVAGNPLDGYWNLLNTRLVIKGGEIVSDQRKDPKPAQDA